MLHFTRSVAICPFGLIAGISDPVSYTMGYIATHSEPTLGMLHTMLHTRGVATGSPRVGQGGVSATQVLHTLKKAHSLFVAESQKSTA